jgi:hypothetical protein
LLSTVALPPDAPDPPADAPDASVITDRDQDGIPDVSDNCPDVANPDQGNEDGDRFGDACDPCPTVASDTPSDPDGDGVADACDPNPNTPGDKIELFEGFHHGLPAWARSQNWTVVGDAVRAGPPAGGIETLLPPIANLDHVTISASVVVEQQVGTTDHFVGVSSLYQAAGDFGVECALYQPAAVVADRRISLGDDFQRTQIGSAGLVWANDTEYVIATGHRGASYACDVVDPTHVRHAAPGTSSASSNQPAAALRVKGQSTRVNWVLVVRSP